MNLLRYTNRLIKVTTPIVSPIFKANKSKLFLLLFLGVVLGFIPAIKSGIESNFLNESNNIINAQNSSVKISSNDVFNHVFEEKKESDFLENLPNYLTNGQTLLSVIVIYLIAIIITFIFEYYAQKIKTTIGKFIFVSIRESALKKALNTSPGNLPKMLNSAGNFSSSIQIGTGNISSVYNFLADTIQYIFFISYLLVGTVCKSMVIWCCFPPNPFNSGVSKHL